jgi:ribonuclease E
MPAAVVAAVAQETPRPPVETVVAEMAPPPVEAAEVVRPAESEAPVATPPVEAEAGSPDEAPPPVAPREVLEPAIHAEESRFSVETVPAAAEPAPAIEETPGQPEPAGFAAIESPVESEAGAAGGGDRIDDLLRQFRERYGRE